MIDRWWDQSYNTTSYTATLSGTHDLVIEYYESGGDNRISFDMNGTLLPVRLLQFNGNLNGGQAELQWKIAPDSNPDYFEIERSHNGQNFQTIGRVEHNRNTSDLFRFTDKAILPGSSYYRLKILDLDGYKTYSPIITLTNHLSKGIAIFPTIVQNKSVFVSSGKSLQNVSIAVFDMTGKKLSNQYFRSITTGQTVLMPLSQTVTPGTYFIEVKTSDERKIKKLLVIE